jgi:hypothetical protein
MQLSLRQASREAGISKSTLARAVTAGRVSATRTEDGRLLFDAAEVHRVFPLRPQGRPGDESVSQDATESGTAPDSPDMSQSRRETDAVGHDATALAALETQIADLKERLGEMRQARDDARQERDEWRDLAKTLGNRPLMLPAPERARRSWLPWRRSA